MDGFTKAHCGKHYRVTAQDLAWLANRIEELGLAVHAVCADRIARLEQDGAAETAKGRSPLPAPPPIAAIVVAIRFDGGFAGHTQKPHTTNHIGRRGGPRFYLAPRPHAHPGDHGTAISRANSTP